MTLLALKLPRRKAGSWVSDPTANEIPYMRISSQTHVFPQFLNNHLYLLPLLFNMRGFPKISVFGKATLKFAVLQG
jgi:hypothetical protein